MSLQASSLLRLSASSQNRACDPLWPFASASWAEMTPLRLAFSKTKLSGPALQTHVWTL